MQVGTPSFDAAAMGEETTIATARPATATQPLTPPPATAQLTPPSRVAFPGPQETRAEIVTTFSEGETNEKGGHPVLRFLGFLLFIAVAAACFYGGMKYQALQSVAVPPAPKSSASPSESAHTAARSAVDSDPQKWLRDNAEGIAKASDSKDPEFLYLYGRALMLTGNHNDATQAFDRALENLRTETKGKLSPDVELRLAAASAALKSKSKAQPQQALVAEQKAMRILDELLSLKSEAP